MSDSKRKRREAVAEFAAMDDGEFAEWLDQQEAEAARLGISSEPRGGRTESDEDDDGRESVDPP